LPQLEEPAREGSHPLVDLSGVEQGRRASIWDSAVRDAFPGLSIRHFDTAPSLGSIDRVAMGAGEMFMIRSAPADVSYQPQRDGEGTYPYLSLMVQAEGRTIVSQSGRSCLVRENDLCVIDQQRGFRLVGEGYSRILFLRLPRATALGRYPQLDRIFAQPLSACEPGTRMLADTLLRLWDDAALLGELQRSAMMNAIVQMLGVAAPFSALPESADWRVRRALEFIEINLPVAGMTADLVAQDQHISRRRLDQLMQEAIGQSISSHLWTRRLEQSAADLRDPHKADLAIAQIAFANGFEDAAHFTRAFKRRYAITPGQWRLN